MQSLIRRWFQAVGVIALLLGTTVPAFAAGDIPVPPAFEGTDGLGHNPMHPLAVIGIVRNTLPPGHSTWFETAYGGPAPLGVTLNYNPPNVAPVGAIQMRVNWSTPNGMPDADWPGYFRVGEGTPSGLPQGTLY